jgi:hypothetical protein
MTSRARSCETSRWLYRVSASRTCTPERPAFPGPLKNDTPEWVSDPSGYGTYSLGQALENRSSASSPRA